MATARWHCSENICEVITYRVRTPSRGSTDVAQGWSSVRAERGQPRVVGVV